MISERDFMNAAFIKFYKYWKKGFLLENIESLGIVKYHKSP